MRILHFSHSDIIGGAAIAAERLHRGLLKQGFDSRLMVGEACSPGERVALMPRKYRVEQQLSRITQPLGLNYINTLGTFNVRDHEFFISAEVLNFHNLHDAYFNYLAIPALTSLKPGIFTLHDMWAFTGHCAYSYDCERWKTGCGRCPDLNSEPQVRRDSTNLEWLLKDWVYKRSKLTVVAPSRWLAEQAKASLLGRFAVHHIPYGLDTQVYRPLGQQQCRQLLGIPPESKVLMFAAQKLTNVRKGGDLLVAALSQIPNPLKSRLVLLTLGYGGDALSEAIGIPGVHLGYVSSDHLKAIAFSAADLFLLPTRADNLPLVVQESFSCGTPVVSFAVGGLADLVRPNQTGYLVQPFEVEDFCSGIVQLLTDKEQLTFLSENCRKIAEVEYPLELQSRRYAQLYRAALQQEKEQPGLTTHASL